MEKVAIFGCGRGLGKELVKQIESFGDWQLYQFSRHIEDSETQFVTDLSHKVDISSAIAKLKEIQPHRIFYIAGGGPYGDYGKLAWQSHEWAVQVSFLAFAEILHSVWKMDGLKQVIAVGSEVAEAKGDLGAASYSASKHALKGLISSLQEEESLPFDLRLMSPGYMETAMLPKNAAVRENFQVLSVEEVATRFLDWSKDVAGSSHFILKNEMRTLR